MHKSGPPHDGHSAGEFSVTADEVTCQQFVELVTEYFEGALSRDTMSQVEEHLVMCDWCVTYVEQMQATIASLRELGGSSARRSRETRCWRRCGRKRSAERDRLQVPAVGPHRAVQRLPMARTGRLGAMPRVI